MAKSPVKWSPAVRHKFKIDIPIEILKRSFAVDLVKASTKLCDYKKEAVSWEWY